MYVSQNIDITQAITLSSSAVIKITGDEVADFYSELNKRNFNMKSMTPNANVTGHFKRFRKGAYQVIC